MSREEEADSTIKTDQESIQALAGLPERYENRGIIGQGGMGMVFKAYDRELGREVAIKLLLFEGSKNEESKERFLREAKALTTLEHLNIVRLLSVGNNASGNLFQVMELLEGKPLSAVLLAGNTLGSEEFFNIFLQVLAGLSEAHAHGIVHRDIKPSNIMLCPIGDETCVKLIDFGIARFQDAALAEAKTLTKTSMILGSPKYMSPEQCRADRKVLPGSDIYSVACVMYESICGVPPFESESPLELIYQHLHAGAPSLLKQADSKEAKRLAQLIDRCLAKDPAERPASCREIHEELLSISKSKLDNDRLFKRKTKAAVNSSKLLVFASLLSIVLLVLGAALYIQLKIQKSSTDRAFVQGNLAQKKLTKEKEELRIRRVVANLRDEIKSAEVSDRAGKEKELFYRLLDLAKARYAIGLCDLAEKNFLEAKEIGDGIDKLCKSEDYKAIGFYNRVKAEEEAEKPDKTRMLKNLDAGLACRSLTNAAMPGLSYRRAKIALAEHDFEKANFCLDILVRTSWVPHSNLEKRIQNDSLMPSAQGVEYAEKVSRSVIDLETKGAGEDKQLLLFSNRLLKYLLDNNAESRIGALVSKVEELLSRKEIASDPELSKQTRRLLLQYARLAQDPDLAEKYINP